MGRMIETECQFFKNYVSQKKYNIYRSCIYESSGVTLTTRIFVHELVPGDNEHETKIGEISVSVTRSRWNDLANISNAFKANEQLEEAARKAKENNWDSGPLPRMFKKGCEIIISKIHAYEVDQSPIVGDFSI